MNFLEELADRKCERLTSREGCLSEKGGYPTEEQCDPCRARAELGRPTEAPRHCETCQARLDVPPGVIKPTDARDMTGSEFCPARRHVATRWYDEFTRP